MQPSTSRSVDSTTPPAGSLTRVAPSIEDPVVRAASEVVGGPAGRRRGAALSWWTPVRVLLVFCFLTSTVAVLAKAHCHENGWVAPDPDKYVHQCYSDIPLLFFARGLNDGAVPYLDDVPPDQQVEYPVLTGVLMGATAQVVPESRATDGSDVVERSRRYFDVNVVLLLVCFAVTVVATARTVRARPWDAALVALAPGIALAGTINWDLWAVMLTSLALLAWARRHPVLAGVLIGLATATKFYPFLLLGPLLLLCLRARRLREGVSTVAAAVLTWLAVNVPVMVIAPEEWRLFYTFSEERDAGFGSIWYVAQLQEWGLLAAEGNRLNLLATGLFATCCAAIGLLILAARRRPRLAQVSFLVVAAFVLTNKVYSPQFVVWLIPLAAMARPRWRDFLIWQACEVLHFVATWLYLIGVTASEEADRALGADGYSVAVFVHVAATVWLMGMVVRDILRPDKDLVRAAGADDPGGGVLDRSSGTEDPAGLLDGSAAKPWATVGAGGA